MRIRGWSRRRRITVLGAGGAVTVLFVLALLTSLANSPFQSADEDQHVSYALDVSSGSLPTLDTVIRPRIPGMSPQLTYTADHPPLFYVLEAVPLRLGIGLGHPLVGLWLGRLVNIAIAAVGLVALGGLVRTVAPGRPALAISAPALLAPIPLAVAVTGQIFNDALALTTTMGALLLCALAILRGPSRKRLALLAAAALLVSATRATGLEVAALCAVSAAAACALHGRGSHLRVVGQSLAAASLIAVTVVAGIGWFYLRNRHLYGDLTGAREIVRRYPAPAVPISVTSTSGQFWLGQFKGMFGRSAELTGWVRHAIQTVGVLLGAGALAGLARFVKALAKPEISRRQLTVAVVLALHVIGCLAILLRYVSIGGTAYPRYLLAAMPVLVIVIAYGLTWLPGRFPVAAITACGIATSAAAIGVCARELAYRHPALRHLSLVRTLTEALKTRGVPVPTLVFALLVAALVVGLGVIAISLSRATAARPMAATSPIHSAA